ncbi:MAG: hypothetical protein WD873_01350, partial [Candidatus Hydrogenedentales bacterium]
MRHVMICALLLATGAICPAAGALEDLRVLPDGAEKMMHDYLHALAEAAMAERREAFEAIDSLDALSEWQEKRRAYFINQLGGFPERNPLNARVVATTDYEDFRIEKIV